MTSSFKNKLIFTPTTEKGVALPFSLGIYDVDKEIFKTFKPKFKIFRWSYDISEDGKDFIENKIM